MESDLDRGLADSLRAMYGYDHVVLAGHSRTLITSLLLHLKSGTSTLVLPNNICPLFVAIAKYSNYKISRADIDIKIGVPNNADYIRKLSLHQYAGVFMPTQLYGQHHNYLESIAFARKASWFILENDTLCASRIFQKKMIAQGDALVTSFGYSKSIDVGHGGALLTNDYSLAKGIAEFIKQFPVITALDIENEKNLMIMKRNPEKSMSLGSKIDIDSMELDNLMFRFDEKTSSQILQMMILLDSSFEKKRKVYDSWARGISNYGNYFTQVEFNPVSPWRYLALCLNHRLRNIVVDNLRAASINCGTNFPPLKESSADISYNLEDFLNGSDWGGRVINLWLDENQTEDVINKTLNIIESSIVDYENEIRANY